MPSTESGRGQTVCVQGCDPHKQGWEVQSASLESEVKSLQGQATTRTDTAFLWGHDASACSTGGFSSLCPACRTGCAKWGRAFVPVQSAVLVLCKELRHGGCTVLWADVLFILPARSAHQHIRQILLPQTPESSRHWRQKGELLPQ